MKQVEMIGPGGAKLVDADKVEEMRRQGFFRRDELPKAQPAPSEAVPARVLDKPEARLPKPKLGGE